MMRAIRNFWVHPAALLGVVILACALLPAESVAAAPSGQAGTGTVTGRVLTLDNRPLPNAHLVAFAQPPDALNRTPLSQLQSDAQGNYSVQVPAGQVWIRFDTQEINGQSYWGYDSLPVTVAAGQTVSGQDFHVATRLVQQPPSITPTPVLVTATPRAGGEPLGLPSTGSGPDPWLPVAGALGLSMLVLGLAQRHRMPR